jgi:3-oxoacyl-[acyl-carrier protein] reductase
MADGSGGAAKVALVTGASRNIGRAIALGLAEDGADVVVHALSHRVGVEEVAEDVRRLGRRAMTFLADVRDEAAVEELFAEARRQLGPVTILVNNAAIRPEARVEELSLSAWQEVLGIILDGAFLCSRAALAQMRGVGWGRIVNIAGRTGQSGAAGRAHVVAGKAGLIGLTKALALECAGDNITVNAVSPGSIDTPRHERSGFASNRGRGNIPLGRLGTPDEIASMVRYLASEPAAYVTGQTISVNGGLYL